jgi:hypothetical protein
VLGAALLGCTPRLSGPEGAPVTVPLTPADSPLFLGFPDLDRRIVPVDPATGKGRPALYPDSWEPEAGHLLDFAVRRPDRLFALLQRRGAVDDPRLFVVDTARDTLVTTVDLPPAPQNLTWDCRGRLLVGHATPPEGPAGRITVVDAAKGAALRSVALAGACSGVVPLRNRALALERTVREGGPDQVLVLSSLAEVDLDRGVVVRRRQLPAGAQQLAASPAGQLYVSHASGPGTMATDGTISVIDRRSLAIVRRLRPQMVVKQMATTRRFLVLNMLSRTGEVWIDVLDPGGATTTDFHLGELAGPDVAVIGETVYVPLRRGHALFRAFLDNHARLPRLELTTPAVAGERLGLMRTWMECDAR